MYKFLIIDLLKINSEEYLQQSGYISYIFIHYAGLMEISVSVMDEPPPSRLLRKVDTIFVDNLKDRLQNDPTCPGVPPLAVTCKNVASNAH